MGPSLLRRPSPGSRTSIKLLWSNCWSQKLTFSHPGNLPVGSYPEGCLPLYHRACQEASPKTGCPSLFSVAVINTVTKSNFRRIEFYFSLHFQVSLTDGKQGRNPSKVGTWRQELKWKSWRSTSYWHAPPDWLDFLLPPWTTCPGMAL